MANSKLGIFLKKYRLDRGMKMREMAQGLDVTSPYLCSMESGGREPTDSFIKRLTRFMGGLPGGYNKIEFMRAVELSTSTFTIRLPKDTSDTVRQCVLEVSRALSAGSLTDDQCRAIMDALEQRSLPHEEHPDIRPSVH